MGLNTRFEKVVGPDLVEGVAGGAATGVVDPDGIFETTLGVVDAQQVADNFATLADAINKLRANIGAGEG